MNRIYQGRVTSVEIPKPGTKNEWVSLPDWQGALWQHHELFQDAVNYYTLALAALAEGLTRDTAQGAAALAWREQVRENWLNGWRKAVRYDGPHKRLAAMLGVAVNITDGNQAFDFSAAAILRANGSAPALRAAALLQLLEEADVTDLNQLCVARLPWFCTPKGALSATPRDVIARQEAERIRQTAAVHGATSATLAAVATELEPGYFVTQMPTEFLVSSEAKAEALKQFKAAAKKSPELSHHEETFVARLVGLGEALKVPQLGRKPSGIYPFALVLHLWPAGPTWEAFKQATKNLVGNEAPIATADHIAETRTEDEPLFDYFTNRMLRREPANTDRAVWFEFDLAAFLEAIKSPHRFYQDTQTRAAAARKRREQLHAIEPDAGWLKDLPVAAAPKPLKKKTAPDDDEADNVPDFTFAGDNRIDRLRALLTDSAELGSLAEVEEQDEAAEYTIQERTLRGWPQIREAWRKRATRGAITPDELWADVAEVQGEHRDDFGSAVLFEALTKPANHKIWLDAPPQADRHADDPLRAWRAYKDLRFELKDKERPIRFTPAHAEKSPRYFILPKTGRLGTEHEPAKPAATNLRFTAGIIVRSAHGLEPVAVRFEYSAPRLFRDELREPGEADLENTRWLQPMMQALGLPAPDKQDFANCRVTLQPSGPENHQLTFPVEVDVAALQKAIGGARWARQFNMHPDGEDFYNASLRWPHEKQPSKPPVPWWETRDSFTTLAVDLGQRDAGAFALIDVRANASLNGRPFRFIGETGEGGAKKSWRATLAASGLLRLPGEDRQEWRKPSEPEAARGMEGFAWREELFGEHGRSATAAETDECAGLLRAFGIREADLMPADWRDSLSFPEQNTKLLVAARRAQSRMARLHRWAWLLADESNVGRIKQARAEISAPPRKPMGQPDPAQIVLADTAKSGDVAKLREAAHAQLQQAKLRLPSLLVDLANRVLPLRKRVWVWGLHPDEEARALGCGLLGMESKLAHKPMIRGQRGLALERIDQIEELRRRFQSLNQSLRRKLGGEAPARRDEKIPDPCPQLLEKLDNLKIQRVNQTAHMILAEALGVRLRAPGPDKARLRAERDQHGQYVRFRASVDLIVIEDLSRYRSSQGRSPRENSRLMKWCHRAIRDKLRELCEPFDLPVLETVAAWSSRFCARSGVPGFRAKEVTTGFTMEGTWAWLASKEESPGKPTAEAVWLRKLDQDLTTAQKELERHRKEKGRATPCPKRTLLVPVAGGPVFVPLCDRVPNPDHPKLQPAIAQSDVNAAINLGLRAIADPRRWTIHPRLRTQRDGKGPLLAKEKRKYGAKKTPAIIPIEGTKLDEDSGRVPNFFFDASGIISWGLAEVSDPLTCRATRVALGVSVWRTVREAQWARCQQINESRLRRWRTKADTDEVPM
jgi:hypothetical protein